MKSLQLGINIDHVATLRQARGGEVPSPQRAALAAVAGGADGITFHLREDRRHIQDRDLPRIRRAVKAPLNLEMALHPEMIKIALRFKPEKVCMVPEKRRELTTEGGLDAYAKKEILRRMIPAFHKRGIEVSLFIAPSARQIQTAADVCADAVELHTGAYANARGTKKQDELKRIRKAARQAARLGLKVHAGHGLDYRNVGPIAGIPEIRELNIGHSVVSRAIFVGIRNAVKEMKTQISAAVCKQKKKK